VSRFELRPAVREQVPILVGLCGPSGSGKTYSALRIAKGMQSLTGGDIAVIDTEARRALHYADQFQFLHVDFRAPFGSLDYLEAIQYAHGKGARNIVVDSASHEHEGPGGLLESHEAELERLAGSDHARRERVKMLAWQRPKAARRRLLNTLLQLDGNFIFCFRAKEKLKMQPGKEPLHLGWMPIAGEEWVFEMVLNILLYPASGGVPTWRTNEPGERQMMKLPAQFRALFELARPLDEEHGRALAEWARGGAARQPAAAAPQTRAPSASAPAAESAPAPAAAPRDDAAEQPCWAPVAGRRCKLAAGHAGNHVPEPPTAAR